MLPVVSATMSSACRIGTPEVIIVPRFLEKRDSAIFWIMPPKIGNLSISGSTTSRTRSRCLIRCHTTVSTIPATSEMGATNTIASDRKTRTLVGAGSSPPRESNIAANVGTMNSSMPTTARIAMMNTTTG